MTHISVVSSLSRAMPFGQFVAKRIAHTEFFVVSHSILTTLFLLTKMLQIHHSLVYRLFEFRLGLFVIEESCLNSPRCAARLQSEWGFQQVGKRPWEVERFARGH